MRLGLSQLARDTERGGVADGYQQVPVFALEATAAHIVDLYEVSANRMMRAVRTRRRRRSR